MTTSLMHARGLMVLAATTILAACGGGSDGGTTTPPDTSASLTITGTAAVGAAITGQPVSVKCATGSSSGVTGSDGSYAITITSGVWPCVAQVTAVSGEVLNTVALASGTSAIANLTPATQLVVAALAGADPTTYFQDFDATRAAAITVATLANAQTQMVSILKSAGVDFSGLGDLIAAAYTTAYDDALLALAGKLTSSGTTLTTLTTAVATTGTPSVVSVSTDLLLQPAAATCSALRSTTYRMLKPSDGAALSAQTSLMTLDASTLKVVHGDGTTGTWLPNGTCRFTEQTGSYNADVVVTQAGVLIARYTDNGTTYRVLVGLPEQTRTLAELAGMWNVIGMTHLSSTSYVGTAGNLTYDTTGMVTAATSCQDASTWAIDVCSTLSSSLIAGIVPLAVDTAGGFDVRDTALTVTGRLFAFKAGSGDLMIANLSDKGELFFSAPVKSIVLPAVGRVLTSWNFDSLSTFVSASAVYGTSNTATSVDTVAGSYARDQLTVGSTVTRPETVFVNKPRTGYSFRPSATVTNSAGTAVTINQFAAQAMPGMGFSPLLLTSAGGTRLFELSATAVP